MFGELRLWEGGRGAGGGGQRVRQYDLNLHKVKPVLVATSVKQVACIKQACIHFPKKANTSKCTCIYQTPVLSKHILIIP